MDHWHNVPLSYGLKKVWQKKERAFLFNISSTTTSGNGPDI